MTWLCRDTPPPLTSTSRSLPPRSSCSNLTRNESDLQTKEKRCLGLGTAPSPQRRGSIASSPQASHQQPSPHPHPRTLLLREPQSCQGPGDSTSTHAGRDFSRFSRSSKVTRLAKLQGKRGSADRWVGVGGRAGRLTAAPPTCLPCPGDNSLANVSREVLQGDIVQRQVAQAAQLGKALWKPVGCRRRGLLGKLPGGFPRALAPLAPPPHRSTPPSPGLRGALVCHQEKLSLAAKHLCLERTLDPKQAEQNRLWLDKGTPPLTTPASYPSSTNSTTGTPRPSLDRSAFVSPPRKDEWGPHCAPFSPRLAHVTWTRDSH